MAENKDLTKLSKQELIEMLRRQEKLLSNKRFLHSLPDKGIKVSHMVETIKKSIASRERLESTVTQFEKLAVSRLQMQNIDTLVTAQSNDDDSDDDFIDNVENQMLSAGNEKEEQMVTCQKYQNKSSPCQNHWSNNGKKSSNQRSPSSQKDILQSKALTQSKAIKQGSTKTWDYESSVTPRSYKFQESKVLSLQESFNLLQDQDKRLKDLQADHAVQKLRDQKTFLTKDSDTVLPVSDTFKYREKHHNDNHSDDSELGENCVTHSEMESDEEVDG